MSIPHSRRPPIPNIFKSDFPVPGNRHKQFKNVGDHNDLQPSAPVIFPAVNAPQPPPSGHRHFILPAPSEKNVKYVPFTRGSKPNYSKLPAALNDQNHPVFQTPASPAQASEASDESTLVAPTPLSSRLGFKVLKLNKSDDPSSKFRSEVLVERTNLSAPDDHWHANAIQDTLNEPPSLTSPTDENSEDEEHVLTTVSDSSDGMMNHNSDTAHLETAASLRSIRSTLDQLRKKRSVSRSRFSQSCASIETIPSSDTSIDQDTTETRALEPEEHDASEKVTETISDLVSQILNIIRPRRCPDHKTFMAKWGAVEYKTYNQRWAKLLKSVANTPSPSALRFSEIPWPVYSAVIAITPIPSLITRENLTRFLICPICDDQDSSLKKISDEIDRWNNFQVMDSIIQGVREADRRKVEEAWSRVVIVLMEIRGDHSSN